MFTSVKAFEGQQYSTLKRQCLQSGLLFEDPRFPAYDDSLFYQGNRIGRVVWKRPRELCEDPHLFRGRHQRPRPAPGSAGELLVRGRLLQPRLPRGAVAEEICSTEICSTP
ncbi:hypothetical protein KUCAC02_032680 [Chaenocephalus aceratus]|nr:hypothetical protein KUCAC02_032680 [Chaenocephalus aceratus]